MLKIGRLGAGTLPLFGLLVALATPGSAAPGQGNGPPPVSVVVTNPVLLNDEPARHPYAESAGLNCTAGVPGGVCNVTFDDVPAGIRRVINHASCQLATQASVEINPVAQFHSGHNEFLPITQSIFHNTSLVGVINQMTLLYMNPGFPDVRISFSVMSPRPDNISIICTLTGYDVALP